MSGYTLREIETDKVVMIKGEDILVIKLIDPSNPKTGVADLMTAAPQQSEPVIKAEGGASSVQRQPLAVPYPDRAVGKELKRQQKELRKEQRKVQRQ
jgi:hypothetical protein